MKKKLNLKPTYLLLVALVILATACDKEEEWVDAVIFDWGSPSADGCGFVIQIENNIYYPVNLEEEYQVDKKAVRLQYTTLDDTHTCGFPHSEDKYQKISIKEIMSQ